MFAADRDIVVLLRRAANEIEAHRAGTRRCLYCGTALPTSNGSKPRKYCNEICRKRSYIIGAKR